MAVTIIGPTVTPFPKAITAPVLEVKAAWGDPWLYAPQLEVSYAQVNSSGQDLERLEFRSRYGSVKQPWDAVRSPVASLDLSSAWVRLSMVGAQGVQVQLVGRVSGEARTIHGSSSGNGRTGIQIWVAYGPLQILRKAFVSRSFWLVGADEKEIGWIPAFNSRDEFGMLVGNRSATKSGGTYLYGGTDTWTRRDALEYVLARFVDQGASGGPAWRLGGMSELLAFGSDTLRYDFKMKHEIIPRASEVLRQLVPMSMGVDFKLIPFDDGVSSGFEFNVFTLLSDDVSYGDASLPRNPNTVEVVSSETIDMVSVKVVRSEDHRYSKIRLIGDRIVVCTSLRALDGSLVPQWTSALEAEYANGTGDPGDSEAAHDQARRGDKFRPVYQHFAAPSDWDYNGGSAAPLLDSSGQVAPGVADVQPMVRRALAWTPMREGFDYSQDPPVDSNPTGSSPDRIPPAAWIQDQAGVYLPVGHARVGMSVSATTLGVKLSASPNHLLGLNHFAPVSYKSEKDPVYDYDTLVATIAFESDQRLVLEHELPPGEGDGSVFELRVEWHKLWYLAPGTVVGVDAAGALLTSQGVVLRNDAPRLALKMAGAISRYFVDRARAQITIRGLLPWGGLVGHVLTVAEEAGDTHAINAPITSVEWRTGDNPQTVIKTGFAR